MDRVLNPAPVRKLQVTNRPDRENVLAPAPNRNRYAGPAVTEAPAKQRPKSVSWSPTAPAVEAAPAPSSLRKVGLYALGVYLFSSSANDLMHHFGGKAYLSWVAGVVMLVAFLASGTSLRGLKSSVGKAWLGFAVCLIFATPFSIWRGESTDLLTAYIPKVLFVFFYVTAFAVTLRDCRILATAYIFCADATLLCCALFGQGDESGRFAIPDSLFFGGANELALALLVSLGFALYLVVRKSKFAQLLGAGQFLVTLFYMLKTGSRGCFLGLVAFLIVWFLFSSQRLKLAALSVPAIALLFVLSGSIMERLVDIALPGNIDASSATNAAQESQVERTMLLRKSVEFALHNPVFGTGPGTFRDALWAADVIEATHTHSLGTHNSYTQVASECGFPAFFFYVTVIFGSLASNFRIMKRTRGVPAASDTFNLALTFFTSLVAFAVATTFDHQAYTGALPLLSGMTAALALASRGGDRAWIESEVAAGNA